MFKKFLILCFLCIFSGNAFANLTSFGLEINKTTLDDVRKLYPNGVEGYHDINAGTHYQIDITKLNIPDVTHLIAYFDCNNILVGMTAMYNTKVYSALLSELTNKYNKALPSKEGDAMVVFQNGDVTITLLGTDKTNESPMIFLIYYNRDYGKFLEQKSNLRKQHN